MLEEGAALRVRHALQHLELHALEHAARLGQDQRVGQLEEIVGGDADPHRAGAGGIEAVLQHPLVVGVGLALGPEGRLRPAAQRGLDALHLEVRSLHDAQRDGRAARRGARERPLRDALLGRERVGQVGLERQARADVRERGPAERAHERLGRDRHVAVLLHVEIDELRDLGAVAASEAGLGGRAVEPLQPLAQDAQRVLARERIDLREDRRDLHRDDLDVRALQGAQVALQAPLRLGLAEEGLPEEVHVHAHALVAAGAQVRAQLVGLGGQHDVGGLAVQLPLDEGHRDARQVLAEGLEAAQQRAVERREEAGDALHVEDVRELIGRAPGRARAERLVGDAHQRDLVGRVLDHAVELRLLAALLGRLELAGPLLEPPRQRDGRLDEVAILARAVRAHRARA